MKHLLLLASFSIGIHNIAFAQSFRKLDNYTPVQVGLNTEARQISDDGRYATGTAGQLATVVVKWDYSSVSNLWGSATTFSESGQGSAISSDGLRVSGTLGNYIGGGPFYNFSGAYRDSGATQLIPALPTSRQSWVDDASSNGEILVGHAELPNAPPLANNTVFRFNTVTNTLEDLGFFGPPGTSAWIRSNGDGAVIVGTGTGLSSVWTSLTGWVDIPGFASYGYEVSDNGRYVIGSSQFSGGGPRGMSYDRTLNTLTDLGTLGGACDMYAITDDAQFAVGASNNLVVGSAVWWRPGHGLRDLNVDFASIVPVGWRLYEARDITPDGRYILGTATNELGVRQAFVIDTVPEPGMWATMGLGMAALLGRRRRR